MYVYTYSLVIYSMKTIYLKNIYGKETAVKVLTRLLKCKVHKENFQN